MKSNALYALSCLLGLVVALPMVLDKDHYTIDVRTLPGAVPYQGAVETGQGGNVARHRVAFEDDEIPADALDDHRDEFNVGQGVSDDERSMAERYISDDTATSPSSISTPNKRGGCVSRHRRQDNYPRQAPPSSSAAAASPSQSAQLVTAPAPTPAPSASSNPATPLPHLPIPRSNIHSRRQAPAIPSVPQTPAEAHDRAIEFLSSQSCSQDFRSATCAKSLLFRKP
jgi:hypothetical protein